MARSNRGKAKKKYTAAQKAAYYKKKAVSAEKKLSYAHGHGDYVVGRTYTRGRGKYTAGNNLGGYFNAPELFGNAGGAAGAFIGNLIAPGVGASTGGGIGKTIGNYAGKAFRKITGFGDYRLMGANGADRIVPSFGPDSIRVTKREYICDIDASVNFVNNVFPINPGLSEVFPWLSHIATNYEQYRFNGLMFQIISTSSDAIASTTDLGLGQLVMATDYNAADAPYVNLPQMLGTMFANSGKPSEDVIHAVECAPPDQAQKLYYVRSGDPPANSDIRLYDLGTFQVATEKMPAVYTGMAQLWVSYDVTFCKSVQNNQLGYSLNTDWWQNSGTINANNPLGTVQALREHSNLGTSMTSTVITFPAALSSGYYMLFYAAYGSANAEGQPTITGTNCTKLTAWKGDTLLDATDSSANTDVLLFAQIWRIDASNAKITFSTDGTYTFAPTKADVVITQINGEMLTELS